LPLADPPLPLIRWSNQETGLRPASQAGWQGRGQLGCWLVIDWGAHPPCQ